MDDHNKITINYDLLAKYFAGEASIDQTREIELWVNESPDHKKTFDSIYYLWIQSSREAIENQINVSESWVRMKFRIQAAKNGKAELKFDKISSKNFNYNMLRWAAVILMVAGIVALFNYFGQKPVMIYREAQLSAIQLYLPDNSAIKLNQNSKISYPEKFQGKNRLIKLEGEAFFEVKPDKEKPFIVETELARVKVVGTKFNIKAFDTSNVVVVIVVEGIVEMSGKADGSERILLKKGEKGKIGKNTGKLIKDEEIKENELFWATRKLVFKDTELYVVAEILSKAYHVELEIINDKIKYCRLNVEFTDAGIDEVIEVLRLTFGLNIEKSGNHYKIDGTVCK